MGGRARPVASLAGLSAGSDSIKPVDIAVIARQIWFPPVTLLFPSAPRCPRRRQSSVGRVHYGYEAFRLGKKHWRITARPHHAVQPIHLQHEHHNRRSQNDPLSIWGLYEVVKLCLQWNWYIVKQCQYQINLTLPYSVALEGLFLAMKRLVIVQSFIFYIIL